MLLTLPQSHLETHRAPRAMASTGVTASVIDLSAVRRSRQDSTSLNVGEVWQALEDGRIFNHYQGQFDLKTNRLSSAEALVRMTDRQGNLTLPSRFIDVAERSDLIIPLGREVIAQACQALAHARKEGLLLDHISVNLSVRQLACDAGLIRFVEETLVSNGMTFKDLSFELTERLLLDADSEAAARLAALLDCGFSVLLDDLGTGYASLDGLQRFSFSGIKLDRSFIANVLHNKKTACITRHLLQIGHELGMTVIAEGIETEGQRQWLLDAGCLTGQGFGLAVPCTIDSVIDQYACLTGIGRSETKEVLKN